MRASLSFPVLPSTWRWLRWRLVVLVAVFILGIVAFCSGVEVSERATLADESLLAKTYYAICLFVLGGLDLGVPIGGPVWARSTLWFVYFAAPAITTSALVEGLLFAIRPRAWRLRSMRGHVVIAGCGRLALLYVERLRQVEPNRPVVIIDDRSDNPNAEIASQRFRCTVLFGDIASDLLVTSLRLQHAARFVLVTGNDYANLDAAAHAAAIAPHIARRTLVHISDIRLLRLIEQRGLLRDAAKFNSYRTAAGHLVERRLLPYFDETEHTDTVILAGFGRFGQTVLAELQVRAAGRFQRVVIVDLEAQIRVKVFRDQVGFSAGCESIVIEGDLRHPATWERIYDSFTGGDSRPVVVLGTGDDAANVRDALGLSFSRPNARIFVRCFERSRFTDCLSRECDFEVVSTADLLIESMHPDWITESK